MIQKNRPGEGVRACVSIWQWDHFCAFDRTVGRAATELSRPPQVKDAVRPGTMPGYARDTPKRKRKLVAEPKAAMAQRLADDSRSILTLAVGKGHEGR